MLGCCNVLESYWCALEQGCLLNPRRGYNQCGLLGYQGPARPAFQFYIKYRYCGCGSGCELCVYFVYAAEWMRAICKAGGAQKLSKPVDQARQNMSTGKTCFFNDYTTVLIGYYDYHPVTKSAKNRVLWLFPNVLLVLKNYLPVTIIGRVPRLSQYPISTVVSPFKSMLLFGDWLVVAQSAWYKNVPVTTLPLAQAQRNYRPRNAHCKALWENFSIRMMFCVLQQIHTSTKEQQIL